MLDALRQVAKKLPGSLCRYKGVVYAVEAPDGRAVLQTVGRRVDMALFGE